MVPSGMGTSTNVTAPALFGLTTLWMPCHSFLLASPLMMALILFASSVCFLPMASDRRSDKNIFLKAGASAIMVLACSLHLLYSGYN